MLTADKTEIHPYASDEELKVALLLMGFKETRYKHPSIGTAFSKRVKDNAIYVYMASDRLAYYSNSDGRLTSCKAKRTVKDILSCYKEFVKLNT